MGYVFEPYLATIPFPASSDSKLNYPQILYKHGFYSKEIVSECDGAHCSGAISHYPITAPYQAFRLAKKTESYSRLSSATIKYNELKGKHLVSFTKNEEQNA